MHRRYTLHKDGDLLVEEFDAEGNVLEEEPVPAKDRLPFEVVVKGPTGKLARKKLLELLEAAWELESGNVENSWKPKGKNKLEVIE